MPGRRSADGLHQAVVPKEGVKIEAKTPTPATVTLQKLFPISEKQATMVAEDGANSGVTSASNMAGRGTDIRLGGNPEFAAAQKNKDVADPAERKRIEEEIAAQWKVDHDEVVRLGGLHIVGTERHESRRIDNQLRGRSGRQGDPGASRFYLSLEDDLMRIFGGERLMGWMEKQGMEEGVPIEHNMG